MTWEIPHAAVMIHLKYIHNKHVYIIQHIRWLINLINCWDDGPKNLFCRLFFVW